MDALDALLKRVSVPRLQAPAPTAAQLDILFKAAMRAPDHGQLRPWRFLTVEADARERLGELFVAAALHANPDADSQALAKAQAMPLRAPLLIVAIAVVQEHPKVPAQEQILAAGCAVHGLLIAAHAQGIGAVWRTGEFSHSAYVDRGLGLAENEQVIGYLYVGTPQGEARTPTSLDPAAFVSAWPSR